MQLRSLQTRLAESLAVSTPLLALYILFLSFGPAQATDIGDDMAALMVDEQDLGEPVTPRDVFGPLYEPNFSLFGRSIVGRAPPGVTGLLNNVKERRNLAAGSVESFAFESSRIFESSDSDSDSEDDARRLEIRDTDNETVPSALGSDDQEREVNDLRRRQQESKTVYISVTTCQQPSRRDNSSASDPPPQLLLYLSTSEDNERPGPDEDSSNQEQIEFEEGIATHSLDATGDVFFGIAAPSSDDFEGDYIFEVGVSTNEFYHSYDNSTSSLYWVDSDSSAALFQTPNLTYSSNPDEIQQIIDEGLQYDLFIMSQNESSTQGIRHSMCGLSEAAQVYGLAASGSSPGKFGDKAITLITTRGPGSLPKQQFHFNGLNASSTYEAYLVHTGGESAKRQTEHRPGGGGLVYRQSEFETKTGDNCKIITDLDFCNETEYAVPANDHRFSIRELADWYDGYARDMYENFSRQLAQVACEAPSTERYSLARNCTDCENAYKKWLCSVTIPRCEDISSGNSFSYIRNLGQDFPNGTSAPSDLVEAYGPGRSEFSKAHNASRSERIDEQVAPGPYREVMPCADLCYDLVRNCPANLGFACPTPSDEQFNSSYQVRDEGLTCNYPGSVHNPSAAAGIAIPWGMMAVSLVVSAMLAATST